MTIEGKLMEGGKTIGSFTGQRGSRGGMMAGLTGTCYILERCARALGKDIAHWLKAPSMDSRIGELE